VTGDIAGQVWPKLLINSSWRARNPRWLDGRREVQLAPRQ
jgi:hypothetical protein